MDFTGGVNYRTDAFQVGKNELLEALNVDVNPDGGFQMRGAVGILNSTAFTNLAQSIWAFAKSDGTEQVMIGDGTKTHFSTGGNFTDTGTTWTSSNRQRSATYKDNAYIVNGVDAPRKWTGAAISNLTQTFNDNLLAPNQGDMIIAKYITVHRQYTFLANTLEAAVAKQNRVRWSHPNEPEDYRTNDFIDIDDGRAGDTIQAIIPFKDRLLVFKQKSIHIMTGYSDNTWTVTALSYRHGACGPDAVVTDGDSVYFFTWPEGVFRYDGGKIDWLFNNIYPKVQDGTINAAQQSKIALGWLGRRLWVSVPTVGATVNNRTYVWDPQLGARGKSGAQRGPGGWVGYDIGAVAFLEWRPVAATSQLLGLNTTVKRVNTYQNNADTDNYDSNSVNIATRVECRWVFGDNAAQRKRFKRADFVIDTDITADLTVSVRRDFDTTVITKQFLLHALPFTTGGLWGDIWDTVLMWGTVGNLGSERIIRGASLGSARATQLIVEGPAASKRFGVNLIIFKYKKKALR